MAIIKWSPFLEPWDDLEKALRVFQGPDEKIFVPAMDVYQDKDKLIVKTPIANFDPKNIKVDIKDNVLTVSGKTEKKSEVDEKNYYRKEIKSGSFQRSILLPVEVIEAQVKADYQDGVLKLTLPITKASQPKGIKVQVKKSQHKSVKPKK